MDNQSVIAQRVLRLARPGSKVLDERIDRRRRQNLPLLKLSGYPTDPLPGHILEAVQHAARENAIAPSAGMLPLRQAISQKLRSENQISADPAGEILITHGAMHAVHLILQAVLEPQDEVLTFSPTYFFGGLIELTGGKVVYAPLDPADGFAFRAQRLRERVTPRTRILLLTCPCNPTGHVAQADELAAIARLAQEHNLLIVSDESYEKFLYDDHRHVSIGSIPEARERTVTIQSFTKSYGMAGWRLGYLAGPRELVAAAQKILEWTGLMCNAPSQSAALAALHGPRQWFADIIRRFENNRNVLCDAVDSLAAVRLVRPQATPFLLLDVSRLSETPADLAQRLLDSHGIPSIAGEGFQAPGYLRIPFGGSSESVAEAARRLIEALS